MPTDEEPKTWFLQFADDKGRPWGDETEIAKREERGMNPWDEGCKVTPLIGGYETMTAIRESLLAAIDQAKAHHGGFGALGHVYFAGWRLNPLRDISDTNDANAYKVAALDATMLGLVLRLMREGIEFRALLWLPVGPEAKILNHFFGEPGFSRHIEEHFWIAHVVKLENERLLGQNPNYHGQIGIVGLDPRVSSRTATHHQKMIVIRVGDF